MLRVGLTGGIGAGKSAVSALLAERGAEVIDYDRLAREVVRPGEPALQRIADRFGGGVLTAGGALDRPALGAIVFHDPESLRTLEQITHPAIRALAARREEAAGPEAIVVHDNALLVEMGQHVRMDFVVVVDVPLDVQIARLTEQRALSAAEARARIGNQTSRQNRTGVADFIIDNTGSLDDLALIVGGLWARLVALRG